MIVMGGPSVLLPLNLSIFFFSSSLREREREFASLLTNAICCCKIEYRTIRYALTFLEKSFSDRVEFFF